MRSILPALLLAALSALSIPLLTPPAVGSPVLAVFAPGTDAATAIRISAEAGGLVIRPAAHGSLYLVRPEPGAEAIFQDRLRAAGAWMLLDPLFAQGCGGAIARPPMAG